MSTERTNPTALALAIKTQTGKLLRILFKSMFGLPENCQKNCQKKYRKVIEGSGEFYLINQGKWAIFAIGSVNVVQIRQLAPTLPELATYTIVNLLTPHFAVVLHSSRTTKNTRSFSSTMEVVMQIVHNCDHKRAIGVHGRCAGYT